AHRSPERAAADPGSGTGKRAEAGDPRPRRRRADAPRLFGSHARGAGPGAVLPRPRFTHPGNLAIDPQVDVDRLQAPFAIGAFAHERVPGAHPEHPVLEGFDIVLEDRPERLDAHVGPFRAHQHGAEAVLAPEVMVRLVVPQGIRGAPQSVASYTLALRPVAEPAIFREAGRVPIEITGIERPAIAGHQVLDLGPVLQ